MEKIPLVTGLRRKKHDLVWLLFRNRHLKHVSETKSVGQWLRHGWYNPSAYTIDFFVMRAVWKWHPDKSHKPSLHAARVELSPAARL